MTLTPKGNKIMAKMAAPKVISSPKFGKVVGKKKGAY